MKNLKIAAIIAEYNPFHNGHLYHILEAKKIFDFIIIILSGNFVQRGEPAIIDKFSRTKMALDAGADIIIELNSKSSTSSAEGFADGALKLISSLGVVNYIFFGTENENLNLHYDLAKILANETEEYRILLKNELNKGISYPSARYNAIKEICPKIANIINQPNNILAIEYLKSIIKQKLDIEPIAIKRFGGAHNSENIEKNYASATSIRNHINSKKPIEALSNHIGQSSMNILLNSKKNNIDNYSSIFQYIIKTKGINAFDSIFYKDEGLGNRILMQSKKEYKISKIIDKTKTKRYTFASISRAIIHSILDIKNYEDNSPKFIRILGFKKESEILIKYIKKSSKIPVVINIQKRGNDIKKEFDTEILRSSLYYINQPEYSEYYQKIVIL